MDDNGLAFSNPTYGQSASYRPVPKPRLSLKKKKKKSNEEQAKQITMNDDISNDFSIIVDPVESNRRSSSLNDIRMTILLEEINSLNDSLQQNLLISSSDYVDINNDEKKKTLDCSDSINNESKSLIKKKKKIPISRELLKEFEKEDYEITVPDNLFELSKNSIELSSTPSSSPVPVPSSRNLYSGHNENKTKALKTPPSPPKKPKTLKNNDNKSQIKHSGNKAKPDDDRPPELPPRKPPRLDVVPQMEPLKLFDEQLILEHLHNDTLSLQRSGYLWKTGPNYKNFKNRWCVLYRHSQNYFDANLSYYFNRSSMSASLSGKIMLAEFEFITVTELIPCKTRLPKIENIHPTSETANKKTDLQSENGNSTNNQSLSFFEIGVKLRQGRIYLFAARSDTDRQQWIHAYLQACTLHAFKNKKIYQCGYVRVKFTINTKWQICFAALTTDRFFYLFEMNEENQMPIIECKNYHSFNLRKTVRVSRIDENCMHEDVDNRSSNDSIKDHCYIDCKYGFSLTQNGGEVVYLICAFESHTYHWYRSLYKFWQTPREMPENLILEEQYLNKDNVPIAVDKCIKFLDTFNQTGLNLFGPMQDSVPETPTSTKQPFESNFLGQQSSSSSSSLSSTTNSSSAATSTTLAKSKTATGTDIDLLEQQNLLAKLCFDSWSVHFLPQKYNACQISKLLLHYLKSMDECIFTETLLPYWIKLHSITNSAEKAAKINRDSNNDDPDSLFNSKNKQMKCLLKLMPPVNYATLRRFIIYLSNNINHQKNEKYSPSTILCRTLFFHRPNKTPVNISIAKSILMSLIQNHVWLFDVTKEELERELQIKRVVNLIISQNKKENSMKHAPVFNRQQRMKLIRSASINERLLAKTSNESNVNSLIIGIKVTILPYKPKMVNVHINQNTTASELFDSVVKKMKLTNKEQILNSYSVFEIVCNRHLQRIILGKEKILPLALSWSNWPMHWSNGACIEIKPTDHLLKGQNKNIKLPNLNVIRFDKELLNYTPTMLMSIIRFCGQDDIRLVKHVLAEFSSSKLFLYCKETHHLLCQYHLDDIDWYVGLETGIIVHYPAVKCPTIVEEKKNVATKNVNNKPHPQSTNGTSSLTLSSMASGASVSSLSSLSSTSSSVSSSSNNSIQSYFDQETPALTFVERNRIRTKLTNGRNNNERRKQNFGQTLVFNSWNELDQWIKGLLEASIHKELFNM